MWCQALFQELYTYSYIDPHPFNHHYKSYEIGISIVSTLQIKKLNHREVKLLAQGHIAGMY